MVSNQLKAQNPKSKGEYTWLYVAFVTFNPMIVGMSIRGSNDNMIALLVFISVFLLLKKRFFLAGFFYGLSIHF